MAFRIYDNRLNRLPSQTDAASWDEMVAWAQTSSLQVDKRRTEWDRTKARTLGIDGDVVSFALCIHQGGIRAILVEFGG